MFSKWRLRENRRSACFRKGSSKALVRRHFLALYTRSQLIRHNPNILGVRLQPLYSLFELVQAVLKTGRLLIKTSYSAIKRRDVLINKT